MDACPPRSPQTPRGADPTAALPPRMVPSEPSRAELSGRSRRQHSETTRSFRAPVRYLPRWGQGAPRSAGPAPRPGLILSRNGWISALLRRSAASSGPGGVLSSRMPLSRLSGDPASRAAGVGRDGNPDSVPSAGADLRGLRAGAPPADLSRTKPRNWINISSLTVKWPRKTLKIVLFHSFNISTTQESQSARKKQAEQLIY